MKRALIITCLLGFFQILNAQNGAWMPPNADYSFPRTLCKIAELDSIRNYLLNPEPHALYTSLHYFAWNYNSPAVLTDDSRRRAAAHAAKDAAFIYLLNRKPLPGGGLNTLTTSEAQTLRDKAISYMERMNTDVEPFPTGFDSYLWRSNEIADNLIAYDLLRGAGVADSTLDSARGLLIEYVAKLHAETTFEFLGFGFFATRKNNHAIRSASVFGLAAVILNDHTSSDPDEQPLNWLATGLGNQDNVMWEDGGRQSEPGVLSGYAEGTHYLKFGCKHLLEFNHAMGNFLPDTLLQISFNGGNRSIRNPWYDPRYELLWEWISRIRMPDGRMPPLEDSFVDHGFPELALTEQSRFNVPMAFGRFNPIQTPGIWRQLRSSTDDLVADYLAARTPPAPDTFPHVQVLPEAGSLIFRSGWDTTSLWFHMYGQHGNARANGVGHNQADAGSFMVHAYGEYLAFDPGYLKWNRRNEVGEADNHNMILINANGPATGAIGSANGADAYLKDSYDGKFIDFGLLATSYRGADIDRYSFFIDERYMILGDLLRSQNGGSLNYAWRLHGAGLENGDSLSGTFQLDGPNGTGVWKKNGISLQASVLAGGGMPVYSGELNGHEITYDSLEDHTTLDVQLQGLPEGSFLASLIPYALDSPVASYFSPGQPQGNKWDWGATQEFTFVNDLAAGLTGLSGDISFEGKFGCYGLDSLGDFRFFFAGEPDSLSFPGGVSMYAQQVSMILLEKIDSQSYQGYVTGPSGSGSIRLEGLDFVPQSAWGGAVTGFQADQNGIDIYTSGSGSLFLNQSPGLGVAAGNELNPPRVEIFPNPAHSEVHLRHNFSGPWEFEVFDLAGKELISGSVSTANTSLDLSGWKSGIYFIRVSDAQGDQFLKLVIQQ